MTAPSQVEAWLATMLPDAQATLATHATRTIVPEHKDTTARRAAEALARLAERERPMELRRGKQIGEGGMGVVHEAEQVALGRTVAVKTLKAGRTDAAAELLREAWITGALEHPNMVPVHHLELDEQLAPLIVMKRIEGVEWSTLIHDGAEVQRRFGATDLVAWNLNILDRVLDALRFAHAKGIIHRDLKPANVMIGNFGEVYLLDWGIAVSLADDGSGRFPLAVNATEMAGTPRYMAPEMLRRDGDPGLSERTDVYLVGAVLFEMISGHAPHQGTTALSIMSSIIAGMRDPLPADAPTELAAITTRAMHTDPSDRYESIEAIQHALRSYLEHRGSASIAANAQMQLAELAQIANSHDPRQREQLYRRLAIVRFAFHEALAEWRDNKDAHAGLARAATLVAEYELACGDPRAAVTLLRDVSPPPPLLARAEAAAAQQGELAAIGRELDPRVDRRTRRIAIGIGLFFSLAPAVAGIFPSLAMAEYRRSTTWALVALAIITIIVQLTKRLNLTPINYRVLQTVQLLFVAQFVCSLGVWSLELDPRYAQVLFILLWGGMFGAFAMAVDRWLLLGFVNYMLAFLVATRMVEYRMFVQSVSTAIMSAIVAWRWRGIQTTVTK